MALDIAPLWDFNNPALSEQRFQAALQSAAGDDALILQTQIARSYGLLKDFDKARALLASIAAQVSTAGAEARVRHALELGRSYASATHTAAQLTPQAKASARSAFEEALRIARQAQLDGLAVDAIHMLAFVDTAPADQLKWGQAALAVVQASSQPAAQKWEASVRNNIGVALHRLERYDEAMTQFEQALALRRSGGNAAAIRGAIWMKAWTLRALGRAEEALALQLELEREGDAARAPDRYVYEELVLLYRARGDEARARRYEALLSSARAGSAP